MTLKQLIDKNIFTLLNTGDDTERQITTPFCCDLLSIAMGRAPAGCAWVTVMANMNTLAVASLADAACIILAECPFRRSRPEQSQDPRHHCI